MVEISWEDESVMEATGIGRADFIKAREAERKPGGDAGVARVSLTDVLSLQQVGTTAAAKMAAPCPNCNHTAAVIKRIKLASMSQARNPSKPRWVA